MPLTGAGAESHGQYAGRKSEDSSAAGQPLTKRHGVPLTAPAAGIDAAGLPPGEGNEYLLCLIPGLLSHMIAAISAHWMQIAIDRINLVTKGERAGRPLWYTYYNWEDYRLF